jgi:hypothetical protein
MAVSLDRRSGGRSTQASPPAVRFETSRWRDPRLVIGVAVVALSALLGARLLGSADDAVGVWAARQDVDAGRPLTADDVARREVRFTSQHDADRYLSSDDPLPPGAVLGRAVGAGELIPRTALGAAAETSLTEVPVSVNSDAVPSTVHSGSVVDVWVTPEAVAAGDVRTARSVRVFDDVSVVSASETGTSLGPSATRQVIIGVTEEQTAALPTALAALAGGVVVLTVQR